MGPAVERINFQNPNAGKPTNLQNSAVLRMLEEEEQRGGRSGDVGYYPSPRSLKDVAWPPSEYDQKTQLRSSFKDVVTPGAKRVTWPPPQEGLLESAEVVQEISVQSHHQQRGGTQISNRSPSAQSSNFSVQQHQNAYSSFNQQQQQQPQQFNRPLKPLDVSSVGTGSPSLQSPAQNPISYGFQRSATPVGATSINKGWAPVQSPISPLGSGAQKYFGGAAPAPVAQSYQNQSSSTVAGAQQFNSAAYSQQQSLLQQQQSYQSATPSAHNQPINEQFQSQSVVQNQFQAPTSSVAQSQATSAPRSQSGKQPFEPPPSLITLRATAPVSQARAPVYSAQPATSSLKVIVGGKHLRGDLKWPPEDVRQRMAEEQQHLIDLSKGPAIRPMKKDKDYTPFFEQHALNHAYPGYKIPPGTQYFRPDF